MQIWIQVRVLIRVSDLDSGSVSVPHSGSDFFSCRLRVGFEVIYVWFDFGFVLVIRIRRWIGLRIRVRVRLRILFRSMWIRLRIRFRIVCFLDRDIFFKGDLKSQLSD